MKAIVNSSPCMLIALPDGCTSGRSEKWGLWKAIGNPGTSTDQLQFNEYTELVHNHDCNSIKHSSGSLRSRCSFELPKYIWAGGPQS